MCLKFRLLVTAALETAYKLSNQNQNTIFFYSILPFFDFRARQFCYLLPCGVNLPFPETNMLTGKLCQRLPIQLASGLRHGHTMRGKPAGVARTLAQRLRGKHTATNTPAPYITYSFDRTRFPSQTTIPSIWSYHRKSTSASRSCVRRARSRPKNGWPM